MPLPRHKPILMVIGTNLKDPTQEAEFNRWYDQTHIPELKQAVPGIVAVTRYQEAEPAESGPKFLAVYELKDEKALADFASLRERQRRGEIHAFTAGPAYDVVWRKAYRPV